MNDLLRSGRTAPRTSRWRRALSGSFLAIAVALGLPTPSRAQDGAGVATGGGSGAGGRAAARSLEALSVPESPPDVDGHLDDAIWAQASVASGFVQFSPKPGESPSQQTEVRVLYTDDAVYVGARMFDTAPDSIIKRLARRDQGAVTDEFSVAFDSYLDRRTAFVFAVSVAGVQRDYLAFDDTRQDRSWNAVWQVKTRVDDQGWTAEFRIPFSQLRFNSPTSADGATWGVNFQRELARHGETSQWSPHPADRSRAVSAFGNLTGLQSIKPSRDLQMLPYVSGQARRAPGVEDDPFFSSTATQASVGADIRYGITNNLTLNATVNPDFGQVEADPAVVNLSAFETFFPEQRPFFMEGVDIFNFGIGLGDGGSEQLFYSRRVGRRPQGFAPFDAEYADVPEATTIAAAAKISGKTSSGWSLGFLDALTTREHATYVDGAGDFGTSEVEPLTNYMVGRAIKDLGGGESAIGGIFTATNRRVDPDGSLFFLTSAAYSGGFDFRHRFGGGNYEVRGYALGSHVRGNPDAIAGLQANSTHFFQRPDATHVEFNPTRTSLSGAAAKFEISKNGGGNWRWALLGNAKSPGFDVNALGFQQRADQATAVGYVGYDQFEQQGIFRRWRLNANTWSGWSFGGERLYTGGNVNGNFQLTNFWGGYAGFGTDLMGLSATALRGGPGLVTPYSYNTFFGVFSDSRKPVRIGLNANFGGELGTGSSSRSLSPNVTVQASSKLQFTVGPSFSWRDNSWQYVTQRDGDDQRHYVMGAIDQQTVSLTTRLNYTFSPQLSLQLYAQPFVSAGSYDQFKEVDDPRARQFGDRFHTYSVGDEIFETEAGYGVDTNGDGEANFGFANPDFNVKSFRSNVVFRWEYRPGSTFYLVWAQDRGDFANDGRFNLGSDFGTLFGTQSTNTFLVKFEHWLGF